MRFCHLDRDFANDASFYRLICLPRQLEGETGTEVMAELTSCEELGHLLHGGWPGRFRHVIDHDEPDDEVAGLKLQRDGWLGRDARGIDWGQ